jgi:hypothetical protein
MSAELLPLDTLASQINAEHAKVRELAVSAVEHAARCGELLLQVKAKLPHGQWLPWLREHCEVSPRAAQGYIRLARIPNAQRVSHLSLRGALKALGTSKYPLDVGGSPMVRLADDLSEMEAALERDSAAHWKRYYELLEQQDLAAAFPLVCDYSFVLRAAEIHMLRQGMRRPEIYRRLAKLAELWEGWIHGTDEDNEDGGDGGGQ